MDADRPPSGDDDLDGGPWEAPVPRAGRPAGGRLREAMRAARIEDAERTRAIADLRAGEVARLEMLREAIEPVLAEIPAGIEMFDAGLIPVPTPRLFIDMVAFVEMTPDKRRYRLVQDTRQGRLRLAESERVEAMRDAVTAYIARRLVEHEKAIATDEPCPQPPDRAADRARHGAEPPRIARARAAAMAAGPAARRVRSEGTRLVPALRRGGALVLNYLGLVALVVLVWVAGHALTQAWFAGR